ncbi:MAG: glycosyltransferase family 39 protein [Pirellula sp.]
MGHEQVNSLESIGSIPGAIASVAWLFLAAWGAGKLLRMLLRDTQGHDEVWQEIVFVIAGLHLIGMCGVCLGMMGLLGESRKLILLGVFTVIGIVTVSFSPRSQRLTEVVPLVIGLKPNWLWLILGLPILLTMGPALNYPTGWDELVYHSVLPRRWLIDGWPAFYVDIPYSGFPSLVELLCWLVASLESIMMPRLFIWVCWLLMILLAYVLFRRNSDKTVGWALTLAMAFSPISLMTSANCYVEAFQFLDLIAILLLLDNASESGNPRPTTNLILIGILVGGCASVKLTGAIVILLPVVWCWMKGISDQRSAIREAKNVGIIVLTSVLFASPFYVRTWLYSGNPFYPYFSSWFSNDSRLLETSLYHHAIGADSFGMRGAIAFLSTPILLAWDGALFDGTFGWQWLILLGMPIFGLKMGEARKTIRKRLWLVCIAIIFYSFWFFSAQQARFALPLFVTITLLACSCVREMSSRKRAIAAVLLVGTTIFSLPWTNAGYYLASWERLLGIWSNTQYVDDTLKDEYVPFVAAIEEFTPADAKLLLLFEHRSMYIPRKCVIGTPFFQAEGLTPPELYAAPETLMTYLTENEFSHIGFALKPIGPDRASHWWNRGDPVFASIERAIESDHLRIQWSSENYMLLIVIKTSLRPTKSGPNASRSCHSLPFLISCSLTKVSACRATDSNVAALSDSTPKRNQIGFGSHRCTMDSYCDNPRVILLDSVRARLIWVGICKEKSIFPSKSVLNCLLAGRHSGNHV